MRMTCSQGNEPPKLFNKCGKAVPNTKAPTSRPIAFPNFSLYQPAAIFIPTGYIPVRKNPVMKRNTRREKRLYATRYIRILEMDPSTEQKRNNFLGEYLSETEKNANSKVPVIKPSWIAEVIIPVS